MERFFSTNMPFGAFFRNVLIVSLVGLVSTLLVYVSLTPAFFGLLVGETTALVRFLRQVVTNGLTVVLVTNYLGFFFFAYARENSSGTRDPALFAGADLLIRALLFFGLHVAVYLASADWFGSFGGSRSTALRVVGPTLARSAYFENISGAYLYATFLSALPVYVFWIERSILTEWIGQRIPRKISSYLIGAAMVVLGAALVTVLSIFVAALPK